MIIPFKKWRSAARAVALALIVAAIPWPAVAGEPERPAPATPAPGLEASIAKVAASGSVTLDQVKPANDADKAALGSKSFFKRPLGIIALAVLGAGAGWMVYSMSHDRIHSDVRATQ